MSSQGQNFLPMNPSQRNRPAPEVIARGHVSVPRSHHRLSPCDVTAETMPCPMTSSLETKIPSCECHCRDTSHSDDVMSGTKRPLLTSSPPGKCFLPEKMSLSMMLSLQTKPSSWDTVQGKGLANCVLPIRRTFPQHCHRDFASFL